MGDPVKGFAVIDNSQQMGVVKMMLTVNLGCGDSYVFSYPFMSFERNIPTSAANASINSLCCIGDVCVS